MSKRRTITSIPVIGAIANVIEVELSYNIGGMNYFTSKAESRGLYLHVSPVQRKENSRVYTGFTGVKTCVKELKRFSQKQLDTFEVDKEFMWKMIEHVVLSNQLKMQVLTGVELNDEAVPNSNILYDIYFDCDRNFEAVLSDPNNDKGCVSFEDAPKSIKYQMDKMSIEDFTTEEKTQILEYRGLTLDDGFEAGDVFMEMSHIEKV
jgi:hypothetical protein